MTDYPSLIHLKFIKSHTLSKSYDNIKQEVCKGFDFGMSRRRSVHDLNQWCSVVQWAGRLLTSAGLKYSKKLVNQDSEISGAAWGLVGLL